ncbi:MAG: biotin/lipoyl-binding protein, partial [Tepidisphaeraceae bacterium]
MTAWPNHRRLCRVFPSASSPLRPSVPEPALNTPKVCLRASMPSHVRCFVASCFAFLLCLAGCKKEDSDILRPAAVSTEPVPVVLVRVKVEPTQRTADVLGTLWGDEETTISAKVSGRVSDVFKDVGDRATAGEVLVQLDRTDYDLIVQQKQLGIQEVLAKLNLKDFPP